MVRHQSNKNVLPLVRVLRLPSTSSPVEAGLDVEKELVVEMVTTDLTMLENVVGLRAG
jgi:hypothetical protein